MQVKNAIEINNLYAVYNNKQNNSLVALRNFSFKFNEKKIYCIIGESGSGKSTLINFFNGLSKPIYGDVSINGIELNCKRYLHNTFISKYKVNLDEIKTRSFLSKKQFKYKNIFIVQTPCDCSSNEVELYLKQFDAISFPQYYKIPSFEYKTFGLDSKLNSDFYVVSSNYNYDYIPTVNSLKDFKKHDLKVKSSKKNKSKKIKNYKIIRKDVGMVYQFPEYQLFKNTVIEDVVFGPRNLGFSKEEARVSAKKQLTKLGMNEKFFDYSPFGLSGGQKRRVAIAGILSINGNILIFDEPTAGLDPKGEAEMLKIIKTEHDNGKTVFIVTHSMSHVLELADEALVLHEGELIRSGDPYEIFYDDNLINKTNIEVPYVIQVIKKLITKNKKYEVLLEMKPKNIDELSKAIIKINGKSKINANIK
ncbi:MAG: ATP-binding cassette domain-containing protein [Mycoplasma sp.]